MSIVFSILGKLSVSVVIMVTAILILDGPLGATLLKEGGSVLDEPLHSVSVIASLVTLIVLWFLQGKNVRILLAIWCVFQLPSLDRIYKSITYFFT